METNVSTIRPDSPPVQEGVGDRARQLQYRPTHRASVYATQTEKMLRDAQAERVALEAEHELHREAIKAHVDREKAVLNQSIKLAEEQLQALRKSWSDLDDRYRDEMRRNEEEFIRQCEAQDRVIRAHRSALTELSPT